MTASFLYVWNVCNDVDNYLADEKVVRVQYYCTIKGMTGSSNRHGRSSGVYLAKVPTTGTRFLSPVFVQRYDGQRSVSALHLLVG